MDVALFSLAVLLIVAAAVASIRAVASWRGSWRLLALAVLIGAALWGAKITLDLRRDPTSHNLWPFEVLGVAVAALVILGGLSLARGKAVRAR